MKAISKMMQSALAEKHMTQLEMAHKLGWTSPQFVSNISRGKASLPPQKWKRFSKATGIPVETILTTYLKDEESKLLKMARIQ